MALEELFIIINYKKNDNINDYKYYIIIYFI